MQVVHGRGPVGYRPLFALLTTVIRSAHGRGSPPKTLASECKAVGAASPLRLLRKWDCPKLLDARMRRILCKRKRYVQVVSFQTNGKLRLRKQEMTKNKGEPFLFLRRRKAFMGKVRKHYSSAKIKIVLLCCRHFNGKRASLRNGINYRETDGQDDERTA